MRVLSDYGAIRSAVKLKMQAYYATGIGAAYLIGVLRAALLTEEQRQKLVDPAWRMGRMMG